MIVQHAHLPRGLVTFGAGYIAAYTIAEDLNMPQMKKQGGGKIINIASRVFFSASSFLAHYVTSKGAAAGLTGALARE